MPKDIIHFEAQTGIIREDLAHTNFYQYTVPVRHRAELEKAAAAATPGSGALEYVTGFMERLQGWEREANGNRTYYIEGWGLVGEVNLANFRPMAGEKLWQDLEIYETTTGHAGASITRILCANHRPTPSQYCSGTT